jgi:cytochrome c oxidase subunit 1
MTTVLEPSAFTGADDPRPIASGLLRRPQATNGFWSWITSVDHKRVGILYGVTSILFFAIGGLEALLIRLQLAAPNGRILDANAYNQVFTMHGTTMVFLVVMPLGAAFMNYLIPLQIGARDVAFPRLNALSYWTFLFGGLFLYSSVFLGGMPNGGWFGYAPNTSIVYSPGHNIDFWIGGLLLTGIASTVGAVNLVVTCLNLRAPGMGLFRMPIFTWMGLVTQFLLLFALPVITIALFLLMFDRNFGSHFFDPANGGDPVMWQHLFWLFGHPEVYIMIMPAFGIVSEIIPTFSRKPLFGYPVMVVSGIAIGFMGWGVWVHHMFATGLGPVSLTAFSISTMFIAVPTGVKIFNWVGTMWKGSLKFTTAMLFAVGLVSQFTIGGLSGVTHSVSPHDRQQTDTYYIVAHFHYVLFGGALFGIFGAIYFWYPKVFGQLLNEKIGKLHFWLRFVGFNMTFGPFHILGLQGMPRRIYTYPKGTGWDFWNAVSTVGAFTLGLGLIVFLINVRVTDAHHKKHGIKMEADPWDARALEWSIPSPTPAYNFIETPVVHAMDDWWHRKYTEDEDGRMVRLPEYDAVKASAEVGLAPGQHVHLPSPSYYPIIIAASLFLAAYGLVYGRSAGANYLITAFGLTLVVASIVAWALEPSTEPEDALVDPDADRLLGLGAGPSAPELAAVGATPALPAGSTEAPTEEGSAGWPPSPPKPTPSPTPTGRPATATRRRTPASPTRSWRCGPSSAPSACCSAPSSPRSSSTGSGRRWAPSSRTTSTTSRSPRSARSSC